MKKLIKILILIILLLVIISAIIISVKGCGVGGTSVESSKAVETQSKQDEQKDDDTQYMIDFLGKSFGYIEDNLVYEFRNKEYTGEEFDIGWLQYDNDIKTGDNIDPGDGYLMFYPDLDSNEPVKATRETVCKSILIRSKTVQVAPDLKPDMTYAELKSVIKNLPGYDEDSESDYNYVEFEYKGVKAQYIWFGDPNTEKSTDVALFLE